MADGITPNYSWILPEDHVASNTWGYKCNQNFLAIDSQVWTNAQAIGGLPYTVSVETDGSHSASYNFTNSLAPSGQQLRWQWQMDNSTESGANTGSNFALHSYDDTGVALATPLSINRATGEVTLTSIVHFPPAQNISTGGINVFGSNPQIVFTSTSDPTDQAHNVYYAGISASAMPGGIGGTELLIQTRVASLQLDNNANFTFAGSANAYKAGGGPWAAISDERIKTVEDDYLRGLEEVCQLRPVVYRYKGNDGGTLIDPGKTYIGLVAQEVEEIMPEMVTKGDGVINGEPVSDLRTLDTTALVFALVNAVRRLKAEIEELKAAR